MIIKFLPPEKSGKNAYSNKDSCGKLVDYLEHEEQDEVKQQKKAATAQPVQKMVNYIDKEHRPYFNQNGSDYTSSEVVARIDNNTKGLSASDDKYHSIVISPSEEELKHIDNDPEKFKTYVNDIMGDLAKSYNTRNRNLDPDDIVWFGKLHNHREYKGTDPEVIEGLAKSGDIKPGNNMHAHIILSARTADQKLSINMNFDQSLKNRKTVYRSTFDLTKYQQNSANYFNKKFDFLDKRRMTFGVQEDTALYKAMKNQLNQINTLSNEYGYKPLDEDSIKQLTTDYHPGSVYAAMRAHTHQLRRPLYRPNKGRDHQTHIIENIKNKGFYEYKTPLQKLEQKARNIEQANGLHKYAIDVDQLSKNGHSNRTIANKLNALPKAITMGNLDSVRKPNEFLEKYTFDKELHSIIPNRKKNKETVLSIYNEDVQTANNIKANSPELNSLMKGIDNKKALKIIIDAQHSENTLDYTQKELTKMMGSGVSAQKYKYPSENELEKLINGINQTERIFKTEFVKAKSWDEYKKSIDLLRARNSRELDQMISREKVFPETITHGLKDTYTSTELKKAYFILKHDLKSDPNAKIVGADHKDLTLTFKDLKTKYGEAPSLSSIAVIREKNIDRGLSTLDSQGKRKELELYTKELTGKNTDSKKVFISNDIFNVVNGNQPQLEEYNRREKPNFEQQTEKKPFISSTNATGPKAKKGGKSQYDNEFKKRKKKRRKL